MAQTDGLCNGQHVGNSELAKRVFDDAGLSLPVDQRHVKAHLGQGSAGFMGQEFLCRSIDPAHLGRSQAFGGGREGAAFLDLDKDQPRAIPQDQVDLAGFAAPAALRATRYPRRS